MRRETKKLNEFSKWFGRYIQRNFGKKCSDFVWNCPVCRAHFVKEIFSDFIEDLIETENWLKRKKIKPKTKK